jgi:hypothetical protein
MQVRRCTTPWALPKPASQPLAALAAQPPQAKLEFLREDLQHLFDDQGIDGSAYDDQVDFRDPITKYSDAQVGGQAGAA